MIEIIGGQTEAAIHCIFNIQLTIMKRRDFITSSRSLPQDLAQYLSLPANSTDKS
jgi:hypothetical protein